MKKLLLVLTAFVVILAGCGAPDLEEGQFLSDAGWILETAEAKIVEGYNTVEDVITYEGEEVEVEHENMPSEGNVFVEIQLAIQSLEDKTENFDPQELKLVDEAGNVYERISDSFLSDHDITQFPANIINFGEEMGTIVFEIPVGINLEDLTLTYKEVEIPLGGSSEE
jgi:hypothetical protein